MHANCQLIKLFLTLNETKNSIIYIIKVKFHALAFSCVYFPGNNKWYAIKDFMKHKINNTALQRILVHWTLKACYFSGKFSI